MSRAPGAPRRVFAACALALALAPSTPARAQYQSNLLTPEVVIGGALGQQQAFAGSVEIAEAGPFDVALTAHAYLEGVPDADTIYEVGICRDDLPNVLLGRTLWRLADEETTGVFEGDTVTVTRATAVAADGGHLYAPAPIDNAVVAFVPEPEGASLELVACIVIGFLRSMGARS